MRPSRKTGEDQPRPGMGVFQATFFELDHSTGRLWALEWPCPSGPRNSGQFSFAEVTLGSASNRSANTARTRDQERTRGLLRSISGSRPLVRLAARFVVS